MPDTNYIATSTELTATADAIRAKTGGSSAIEWEENKGFEDAIDAIQTALPTQTKSATPTESAQTITPDSGYVLDGVDVGAIASDYVGSGITRRSSTDLEASGATVTAPAGYYSAAASKAVASGSQGTPSISVSSAGLITASCTDTTGYITGTTKTATQQMTARTSTDLSVNGATVTAPAGYYNAAASTTVASGSAKPPSSISGTSATVSTGTNTLTLSKTISVTPTVTAGYVSSGTAGNVSVSLTGSVTTKAAATITPGTSNQTIAAGTYLTGAQTISGDANLLAANIKSGVSLFGVTGTYAGSLTYVNYYQSQEQYISNARQAIASLFPSNGTYLVVIGGGHWRVASSYTNSGSCLLWGWITKSGNTYTKGTGKSFYALYSNNSVSFSTGNNNDINIASTYISFTSHIHDSSAASYNAYNIATFKQG